MIEVYKTNITCPELARQVTEKIHEAFGCYRANFDLEDCDNILRIVSSSESITTHFIDWLKTCGCHAEILPDT